MTIQLHLNKDMTAEELRLFSTVDAIRQQTEKATRITQGPYNQVWRLQHSNGQNYYIKIYHKRGRYLRRYCARSRARGEWENLAYFKQQGILVPDVLVYGESSKRKNYQGGFLIQREISNSQDLSHSGKSQAAWLQDPICRKQVLLQAANYLRQLHNKRFIHKDFKWRNILVKMDPEKAVYLIDCPLGQRHFGFRYTVGQCHDLRDFDKGSKKFLSRTDRLRLYLAYQQRKKLMKQDKHLINKILEHGRE